MGLLIIIGVLALAILISMFYFRFERKRVLRAKSNVRERRLAKAKDKKHQPKPVERLTKPEKEYISKDRIVGLAKPKGFFTRLIMNQKLPFLKNRLAAEQEGSEEMGFWQRLVNAQERTEVQQKEDPYFYRKMVRRSRRGRGGGKGF